MRCTVNTEDGSATLSAGANDRLSIRRISYGDNISGEMPDS
jgi:hypothetical protein